MQDPMEMPASPDVEKEVLGSLIVHDKVIDTSHPGELLGEMALVDQSPRSATAVAKTACKVVPVNERQFSFMVQETPHFAITVMRAMCNRLRKRFPEA